MSRAFGRVVRLEVGAPGARPRVISSRDAGGDAGISISVDVRRTAEGQDDQADVRALGLSYATRAALLAPGAQCRILAGLGAGPTSPEGQAVQVLTGTVVAGSVDGPRRAGGDRIMTWTVTDGGYDLLDVTIQQTWRGPVRLARVLDDVIRISGLARGSIVLGDPSVRMRTGVAVSGRLRDVLDEIAVATGSRIVVRSGAVEAWPVNQPQPTTGYTLTESDGLVEAPSRVDDVRWSVRCPAILGALPGDPIRVRHPTVTGTLVAEDVSHALGSHDGPWQTTITGQILGAS